MSIHFGGKKVKEMYWAGRKVKEAWYEGKKVYSSGYPLWVLGKDYSKGDMVTVDIYGDIYRFTALVDHYSTSDSKPFFGNMSGIYWGNNLKIN
ncbi:hypothetical protein ACN4DI_01755 [Corynebacterium macclintockiae]|uniref:hypothetical protein n=1 Tax=Corynebacterium macclintockiae TaxID=2913501 RepID=UPI003EBE7717